MKTLIITLSAALGAFLSPVIPAAACCTAAVLADVVTAIRLSRRAGAKISSQRFAHCLVTLAKVYFLLLLAHGVDTAGITQGIVTLSMLNAAACAVIARQALSVIENEATLNNAPWAKTAMRYLQSKLPRHQ